MVGVEATQRYWDYLVNPAPSRWWWPLTQSPDMMASPQFNHSILLLLFFLVVGDRLDLLGRVLLELSPLNSFV